jgi:hypothetical protein
MNCPCDQLVFPEPLNIPAGLSALPRQIATFPEFRAAMLNAIPAELALQSWRARSIEDFGVMLLEMWAYVCDGISFYDEVKADEFYLRTAQLRPSVRMLTGLLGYVPRPAVAALADLAVFIDGRQPLTLPIGTGFRSGAFPGGTPQVFELVAPAAVHPFDNQWIIAPNRPATIDGGKHILWLDLTYLRLDAKSNKLKKGSIFLFEILGEPWFITARTVASISDFKATDGTVFKQITLSWPITVPGSTPIANIRLTMPSRVAHLTTKTSLAGEAPIHDAGPDTFLHFDAIYNGLGLNSRLILEKDGDVRYFTVPQARTTFLQITAPSTTTVTDGSGTVTAVVNNPGATAEVTDLQLDRDINDVFRRQPGTASWSSADAPAINVHFSLVDAATVVAPAFSTLIQGDPLPLTQPIDTPQNGKSPGRFQLEDKNGFGFGATGMVDFPAASLTLDATTPIPSPLAVPVNVYGNIVTAVRGETVASETMGLGDATVLNQQFTLKKSPLTYTSANTDAGVANSLKIFVAGVLWSEVPSFFGVGDTDQVYMVRQDEAGDSIVTFNGRLGTGAGVVATYRFGAGVASPPAGSIKQLAKPAQGLTSVRNPVAAYGGADAEPASQIQTLAPRSALLLGRAISIPDMQVAAAQVPGVRAASAEWNWSAIAQSAVVHIYYVGDPSLATSVRSRVRSLADPTVAIRVDVAVPIPVNLSIAIEIDPKLVEDDVLSAVRIALLDPLVGLLPPERLGIGAPVFCSQIFETVLAGPGALGISGVYWNGLPITSWGISPGAGNYFDIEAESLLLNGKAGVSG